MELVFTALEKLMNRRWRSPLARLLPLGLILAGLAWLEPVGLRAQPQVVPETVFTVGTSAKDSQGRRWGYVLWQATDQRLVFGKTFAIYAKPGDAGSASPYELKGINLLQTEPAVIQALLNRGVNLGDDLVALEQRINNLFLAIIPPGSLSLADKLSAVIRGSLGNEEHFRNLVLLGRLHPGVNLCLGYAHAELVPAGKTTFEVREYDKTAQRDLGVVGRVTIDGDLPVVLPAPGAPVAVPEGNAKGDLNVKLRWATSAELRRLALLNYGFNVYRMSKVFAEAKGYHTTPPSVEALKLALAHPANAVHLNELPILKSRDFEPGNVADFVADPTTAFLADDNGRYRAGGQAFKNGEQFYYFVTARDVLSRDGLVSPGTLVTICDRMPPDAPRGLQVLNDYSFDGVTNRQVLKVSWLQHTNLAQDKVTAYFVYRWENPSQVQALGGSPVAHRIAGPLPHVAGAKFASYVDDGAGSPQSPADYGKTIWYTVRSVDDGACDGGNLSAHSVPAFGVLRDRAGPDGPGGGINVICCVPEVVAGQSEDLPDRNEQVETLAYYQLVCERRRPEIEWAEFYIFEAGNMSNYITRVYFAKDAKKVEINWSTSRGAVSEGFIPFFCRVGTDKGEVSDYAVLQTTRAPKFTTVRLVPFVATVDCRRVSQREATSGKLRCGGAHNPQPGGPDEPTEGVEVVIVLTPGTKEYRLYRRVDFGPLTLIKQGPANFDDASQITVTDPDMPANSGIICYYGQLFDEHGNASPLVQIGDCLPILLPTPRPMLAPIEAVGDEVKPQMKLRWFCPPYGVERFEVAIANELGTMPAEVSTEVSPQTAGSPVVRQYFVNGQAKTNTFALYRTPKIGPAFGNEAMFEVTVNISLGIQYTVMVSAVGKSGAVGLPSNAESFSWAPPPAAVGPDVPWPPRPLPNLNIFNVGMLAFRLPNSVFPGVGIRIGEYPRQYLYSEKPTEVPGMLRTHIDPVTLLYTNKLGEALFPVAVYRVQLVNPRFPQVSGDLVQVTPLMEEIAYEFTVNANNVAQTVIHDPFVRAVPNTQGSNVGTGAIYLLDTQPVLAEARYLYLVVRFGANGEVLEVVPTNPVEVTP